MSASLCKSDSSRPVLKLRADSHGLSVFKTIEGPATLMALLLILFAVVVVVVVVVAVVVLLALWRCNLAFLLMGGLPLQPLRLMVIPLDDSSVEIVDWGKLYPNLSFAHAWMALPETGVPWAACERT